MKTRLMIFAVAAALGFASTSFATLSKDERKAEEVRINDTYKAAKEKCDDLKGNEKSVCQKDAKAALTRAKSEAKVSKESNEQKKKAADKVSDTRKDANRDTREAEYKAVRERCDALPTDAKARCVDSAKARFGQS